MASYEELVAALTADYLNVYIIKPESDEGKVVKLDGYVISGVMDSPDLFVYSTILNNYTQERVCTVDREIFLNALMPEPLCESFADGRDKVEFAYRVIEDSGLHHYSAHYARISSEGEPLELLAGFRDVENIVEESLAKERIFQEQETEYKRALEEQAKILTNLTRSYLNVYIANVNDGTAKIFKLDGNYSVEVITKLKGQVFPYDAIISQWCAQCVHPDDQERVLACLNTGNVSKQLEMQEEYVGVYRSVTNDKVENFQFNLSKLDDKGNVICGFQSIDSVIDEHLAEEKKHREKEEAYQKELIAARNEADRANAAKTEFLLRMSHDIRTPLNGIIGMLDIAERFPEDLEKQSECRAKVKESSKILLELVNEVLDMSKLDSGEIFLECVPFSIVELTKELSLTITKQAEERGIRIIQKDCSVQHKWLMGSPLHFKRLIMNILSNAIKYNVENGKVFVTCREVSCEDGVATIEFKCRDTGIGMSEEFQEHLFEPFAQEGNSSRSKYMGTGLGMSIAKSIVNEMNGTIAFQSQQGEGTTFDVLIPFRIATENDVPTAQNGTVETGSIEGLNILLVEDNDLNMEIAQFMLEEEGANVEPACDGKIALDAFEASAPGQFDVILMDVMMPVMDGYEATRKIRSLDRADAQTIPIIAMTANAFVEDKMKAKDAGMNEHIAKPLDINALVNTIATLVN